MVLVDGGAVRDQLVVAARSNMLCCGGRKVSIRAPVSCVPSCVFTCVESAHLSRLHRLGEGGKAGAKEREEGEREEGSKREREEGGVREGK